MRGRECWPHRDAAGESTAGVEQNLGSLGTLLGSSINLVGYFAGLSCATTDEPIGAV